MPWIEATLRGQPVLARARPDRSLVTEAGRVEIRYKPTDGRAYRAAARNVEILPDARLLPDDACSPAAPSGRQARPEDHVIAVPHGAWVAYTDGACSGNPGPAGCGVVLVSPDGTIHERAEYLGEATNNVAELMGILRALEWIPRDSGPIVVRTDSQYAIGVLQKGWKAKANQELVAGTKAAVQSRRAHLVYVPGHQGVALNERADQLAREAVQTRSNRGPG